MKYVVDSSVAFKWVVAEIDADKALLLRDDFRNGVHELLAPDLFPAEIANSLLVAERRGRINPGQFPIYLADVMSTPPRLESTTSLLKRVVAIVPTYPISVYDCLYVALAEREGCQLVTADDKLIRDLQGQFPFVLALATMP